MYVCNFSIKSKCSLSQASRKSNYPIYSLYVSKFDNVNSVFGLIPEFEEDPSEIKKYFKADFLDLNIITEKRSKILLFTGAKRGHGIMSSLVKYNAILIFPFYAVDGKEHFMFLHNNKAVIDEILSEISYNNKIENYEYEKCRNINELLNKYIKSQKDLILKDLSKRDREIIKKAYYMGFFDWPRKFELDTISKEFGISKTSALYHIRKAEKKMFDLLFF